MTKKSMKHASADVGLIFTCYNLRRNMNLVDKNQLKKFLKELTPIVLILTSYLSPLDAFIFSEITHILIETTYPKLLKNA